LQKFKSGNLQLSSGSHSKTPALAGLSVPAGLTLQLWPDPGSEGLRYDLSVSNNKGISREFV
jgi:hypothetical protein